MRAITAFLITLMTGFQIPAQAFEDTKVLPRGVRRLSLRIVNTEVGEKSDGVSNIYALARPLQKQLTFKDVFKNEINPVKKAQSIGYTEFKNYDANQSLGRFDADLKARMTVFAPILAWGVTDSLTLALAVPIYDGASSVAVKFNKNERADEFVQSFTSHESNNIPMAREVSDKLNNAVGKLNETLSKNGYQQLGEWRDRGLGDVQLLAKFRAIDTYFVGLATTLGTVIPTGRVDDPNIMTDLPFGDGQWDVFGQVTVDEKIIDSKTNLTAAQFVRYTEQLPGERTIRLATDDEPIAVPAERVKYKLGNKIELGTALLVDTYNGVVGGIGYNYFRKFSDFYRVPSDSKIIERDTDQAYHQGEVEVGYSTIPAFRRNEFPVPFETRLSYKHIFLSRNTPLTQFVQLETGVFF